MKFIPNSNIKNNMMNEIKIKDIEELFFDIPKKIRINKINLNDGLSQQETEEELHKIAQKNKCFNNLPSFLGGGIKPHYIPSVVKSILARSEFYTSYTPYQPEASQGFLQAMFEYQSLIAEITGMDIANASLYDGATALGEAALMCSRINKRNEIIIPTNISWNKKCILNNYIKGSRLKLKEFAYNKKTGEIDIEDLKKKIDKDSSCIYIENPNFFGIFEQKVDEIRELIANNQSLFIVGVDPISLGIAKSPGEYGADIVVGEGRCLGNSIDFGGSSLGIFACKNDFLRQIPGRLIGITKDIDGNRAFCMTLQTREQHIRRGRATSNICTNEGVCALAATVYLSWLGSSGFQELSKINFLKGKELAEKITSINGYEKVFSGVHFNEFVIRCENAKKVNKELVKNNFHGGLILDDMFPELKNCILFGVTEMHTNEIVSNFIKNLREI
jgi:glycine dehydrogenase subunit 1